MSEADTIYKHIPPNIDEELKLYKNYIACEYHKKCIKEEMQERKRAFFDLLVKEILRNG